MDDTRPSAVAAAFRLHHLLSHHLSILQHWACRLADHSRSFDLVTGRTVYRVVFDFWLKIFGVAFGMGVVSGIVMAFQFGTDREVLARMTGPI